MNLANQAVPSQILQMGSYNLRVALHSKPVFSLVKAKSLIPRELARETFFALSDA